MSKFVEFSIQFSDVKSRDNVLPRQDSFQTVLWLGPGPVRLIKKTDSVSHLRCLKHLYSDNLVPMLLTYFVFSNFVNVTIHINICALGVICSGFFFHTTRYASFLSWSQMSC